MRENTTRSSKYLGNPELVPIVDTKLGHQIAGALVFA
jgi:hypothetical protein